IIQKSDNGEWLYMDEKCMKTPVYTVETVFKDTVEVPLDIDFSLPDYCPEISRILKCCAAARTASKSVSGRAVTVDGSVTVTVIYSDPDGYMNSYEYQYPFSKSFDIGADSENGYVTAKAKCEYINCRAQSERKIDIHGAVGVTVCAYSRKSREIICDIDDKNIEVLRVSVPSTMPIGYAEKYAIIEEEIEAASTDGDIKCLIRYGAVAEINECKLLENKAIVKGNMAVELLYRTDNGDTVPLGVQIPFSQLLEAEGANESCRYSASADIAYLEVKPKFDSASVARGFTLDAKILIKAEIFCSDDISVIADAYSKKHETAIKSEEAVFSTRVSSVLDTFTARGEVDLSPDSVIKICDVWCEAKTEETAFDGDCMTVTGSAVANILALDDNGAPVYFEKTVDFSYNCKIPCDGECLTADAKTGVISVSYNLLSDGKMDLQLQMSVAADVYKSNTVTLVGDIQVNESRPVDKSGRAALTVYFGEEGESVFDIARKYLADIGEIKQINSIGEDRLSSDRMILIPAT
ncbi:MAG: DUF3794 domain-containing protein, partial [Clostridia bacterium]|nr:DUF3794 domain-containing protein [Clostridia bacterium]